MEWHEVGVKVSSLKHFTFLTSITLVLLGFIWATVVRQVMCSDAERCVVKSHQLLAKALASQSQTPVSHWYEGEVQPGWVFPWHPPGRSHGFSCHLTAGGKWLDQCSALRAEKAPRKGRASLRRSHNHTKIFFFNATRAVHVFLMKYYMFPVSFATLILWEVTNFHTQQKN